ncbi:15983_t:CDS:1 [Acaulospora colombiana]|uniref:15983_t:CDS:1 n=1 Tax=Acaulospora colombiana TaxID=27376 RepID=A0ACA9LUL0_9GLOM|nr:15983_t:CDS:1 [Acaulospora colombiana]
MPTKGKIAILYPYTFKTSLIIVILDDFPEKLQARRVPIELDTISPIITSFPTQYNRFPVTETVWFLAGPIKISPGDKYRHLLPTSSNASWKWAQGRHPRNGGFLYGYLNAKIIVHLFRRTFGQSYREENSVKAVEISAARTLHTGNGKIESKTDLGVYSRQCKAVVRWPYNIKSWRPAFGGIKVPSQLVLNIRSSTF